MKRIIPISLVLGLGLALGVRANLATSPAATGPLTPPPAAPQAVEIKVLEAHPFVLENLEPNWMQPAAPGYSQGTLLVLEGPAERFMPRQTYENVLYVGTAIPESLNTGEYSGRRVVIVPGDLPSAQTPVFFGAPELPERVTLAEAARQLDLALEAGARPVGAIAMPEAKVFADGTELRRFGADLIERFSPDEVDVISGFRAKRL